VEVHKLFDMVDEDGSGLIDEMEMVRLLSRLGKSLQREELDEGFAKLDKDSFGSRDFDEFYRWYKEIQEKK
jgi:Ca2+-binding EF-hand superfamily protein